MVDDYELVASKRISKLRDDLDRLKENRPGTNTMEGLQDSIEKLSQNLSNVLSVFEEAAEEMKLEDRETEVIAQKIDPLMDKLDAVMEQNKKIAQGVVAVADMINEMKANKPMAAPKPKMMPEAPKPEVPPMAPPNFKMPETTTMGVPPPPGMAPPPIPEQPLPNNPPMPPQGAPPMPPIGEPPKEEKKESKGFLGIKFTK